MRKRLDIHIWLLTVWLLLSCTAMSYANSYEPAPWNGQAVQPTYEFRSTSSYPAVSIGTTYKPQVTTPFASTPNNGPRRTEGWGWGNTDPEDDPVGEVPVGEPLVLLGILFLYVLYRGYRLRKSNC